MHRIKRTENGIIISRLMIDMMRTSVAIFLQQDNATTYSDELMMCAAIFIGQAEGKPFTAGKIASYIGMPRPTVVRKLHSLCRRGFIVRSDGKRWSIALDRDDISARVNNNIKLLGNHIQRAASDLSRLDSLPIARNPRRQ